MSQQMANGFDWLRHLLLIQGGMGVGISSPDLARAVAQQGQLGMVSATALNVSVARKLQDGDQGGHIRRAFDALKLRLPRHAANIDALYTEFWLPGGRQGKPYEVVEAPDWLAKKRAEATEYVAPTATDPTLTYKQLLLIIAATYAEVRRAKEGHDGKVGINFLMKIKPPTLAGLFGAMLADVDAIAAGAGDPSAIPAILDGLAAGRIVTLTDTVGGAKRSPRERTMVFDPMMWLDGDAPPLHRPACIAIVSSHEMAAGLAGLVDGLVIENNTAGGHKAPPFGQNLTDHGPVSWGERDQADLAEVAKLGLPFWLAGGYGQPNLEAALELGATGIQVGSLFALCNESGMMPELRERVLKLAWQRNLVVVDLPVSPTGYPFGVALVPGTLYEGPGIEPSRRNRICDVCILATMRETPDSEGRPIIAFVCPAEPNRMWAEKGGLSWRTELMACLCNGLLATAGVGQLRGRDGAYRLELPLVTLGQRAPEQIRALQMWAHRMKYSAADVLAYLLGQPCPPRQ